MNLNIVRKSELLPYNFCWVEIFNLKNANYKNEIQFKCKAVDLHIPS